MPTRMHEADLTSSVTPVMKKRKKSGSPLLATPTRVLEQVKNGENPDEERMIQALCNVVISAAAVDGEEDEESVKLLTELLAEEGVDPNAGHQTSWDKFGGTPLYQACKLDLPETVRALLEHGASVVQEYNGETPLQVALGQGGSHCVKVIMDHIATLEKQARAGRKREPKAAIARAPHHHRCEK